MKPSDHLRWSCERLLELARDERRARARQRAEAAAALLLLPLVFALAVAGTQRLRPGSAVPSLSALALVGLVTSLVLWFRQLRGEPVVLPGIEPYAGLRAEDDAAGVRARLQQAREDLTRCCRDLRAQVQRGAVAREQAWWPSLVTLLLLVLVLALRWLP